MCISSLSKFYCGEKLLSQYSARILMYLCTHFDFVHRVSSHFLRHSEFGKRSIKRVAMHLSLFFLGFFLGHQVLAQQLSFNVQNQPNLQRGARLFMNYCSGCHSLNSMRYYHMVEGLGLTHFNGQINNALLKNNLIFTQATINDPIRIALPAEDAKQWFGVVPPDLSLIAKEKGTEWIYTYLSSFYKDDSRPFGTNNYLVPDVAMPNILETLNNDLSKAQFDSNLRDIVIFLSYVSEPAQFIRYRLGIFVIGFLVVLFFFSLGLKAICWRKINIK